MAAKKITNLDKRSIVTKILVKEGSVVNKGDRIFIVETRDGRKKAVLTPISGVVTKLFIKPGSRYERGSLFGVIQWQGNTSATSKIMSNVTTATSTPTPPTSNRTTMPSSRSHPLQTQPSRPWAQNKPPTASDILRRKQEANQSQAQSQTPSVSAPTPASSSTPISKLVNQQQSRPQPQPVAAQPEKPSNVIKGRVFNPDAVEEIDEFFDKAEVISPSPSDSNAANSSSVLSEDEAKKRVAEFFKKKKEGDIDEEADGFRGEILGRLKQFHKENDYQKIDLEEKEKDFKNNIVKASQNYHAQLHNRLHQIDQGENTGDLNRELTTEEKIKMYAPAGYTRFNRGNSNLSKSSSTTETVSTPPVESKAKPKAKPAKVSSTTETVSTPPVEPGANPQAKPVKPLIDDLPDLKEDELGEFIPPITPKPEAKTSAKPKPKPPAKKAKPAEKEKAAEVKKPEATTNEAKPATSANPKPATETKPERAETSTKKAKPASESETPVSVMTVSLELNMEPALDLINNLNKRLSKLSITISPTTFLIKALSTAIKNSPQLNAHYKDNKVTLKKDINFILMMQTATDFTAVGLEQVDLKSLKELQAEIDRKENKLNTPLSQTQLANYGITITDFSALNLDIERTNLMQPQVLSIALGKIRPQPMIIGKEIQVVQVLKMSFTINHDAISINEISSYMEAVKSLIADPELLIIS